MNKTTDIGTKFKDKIASQYPEIDQDDIPELYTVNSVNHRSDDIERYHIIFWHRLLRSIYEDPTLIECELYNNDNECRTKIQTAFFRKIQGEESGWEVKGDASIAAEINSGRMRPFPVSWKYFIRLPSGGILELCSMKCNTIFRIVQVISPEISINQSSEETKKFINLLLEEANRVRDQLFQPTKEFEKQKSISTYLLFNLYLSNYRSAEAMLGVADSQEAILREESLIYDASTSDIDDPEKRKYMEQRMLTCGMFYCSSIVYFFMALEGFVNLVFHSFLKNEFRDRDFNINQRFDLEQKIRFMPSICKGFNENNYLPSEILLELKMLKNYRNSLLHSKIEDSLKCLNFCENDFYYNYEMETHTERFLPSHKFNLTMNDVVVFKSKVDKIVNYILKSMNQNAREETEAHILNKPNIFFAITETGDVGFGGIK